MKKNINIKYIILVFLLIFFCLFAYSIEASENIKEADSHESTVEKTKQIASFKTKDKALELINTLKKEGKDAFYTSGRGKDNKIYYRVFIKIKDDKTTEKTSLVANIDSNDSSTKKEFENKISLPDNSKSIKAAEQNNELKSIDSQNSLQLLPENISHPTAQPVLIDFKDYINRVISANPSLKISEEDYRQTQIRFMRNLEAYGINVSLNGNAGLYYDRGGHTGVEVSIDASKNLYDSGKRQILEKELEIVKALTKADLLSNYDTAMLSAAAYYADFYYSQEILDFLKEQYNRQRAFIEKVQESFNKGIRFTIYDSLTAQYENLQLEKDLLQQKANIIKSEISFRQFGHVYTENPIRLAPMDFRFKPDIDYLQKYAISNNNSIFSARLQEKLQNYRVFERKAEGGIKIDAGSSIKFLAGSTDFTGGTNFKAGLSLRFSLPLLDGGVRKSDILAEQIETLKQRLRLEKVTEDVIKKINEVYIDFQNLEQSLKILEQQLEINEKRLAISLERLEKGLEEYRSVKESWNDLINSKISLIQQRTLSQKLLVDIIVLSGKRLFN
ncbi:MAG: TolC family protein [Nitrospirae bacterium]|jgi:outer membrane protein TolC|nr:TolC family protein [Nitrospirota bacterium]